MRKVVGDILLGALMGAAMSIALYLNYIVEALF